METAQAKEGTPVQVSYVLVDGPIISNIQIRNLPPQSPNNPEINGDLTREETYTGEETTGSCGGREVFLQDSLEELDGLPNSDTAVIFYSRCDEDPAN